MTAPIGSELRDGPTEIARYCAAIVRRTIYEAMLSATIAAACRRRRFLGVGTKMVEIKAMELKYAQDRNV
jgi:hypothetical protein